MVKWGFYSYDCCGLDLLFWLMSLHLSCWSLFKPGWVACAYSAEVACVWVAEIHWGWGHAPAVAQAMSWDGMSCGKGLGIQNIENVTVPPSGVSLTSSDKYGLLLSGERPFELNNEEEHWGQWGAVMTWTWGRDLESRFMGGVQFRWQVIYSPVMYDMCTQFPSGRSLLE